MIAFIRKNFHFYLFVVVIKTKKMRSIRWYMRDKISLFYFNGYSQFH